MYKYANAVITCRGKEQQMEEFAICKIILLVTRTEW